MTYFPDLTEYKYLDIPHEDRTPTLNIGWLDSSKPFVKGETSELFKERLFQFCQEPHAVHPGFGYHKCPFCEKSGLGVDARRGSSVVILGGEEIRVIGIGFVYAAPTMIYHYVAEHGYVPPEEFVSAVLNGPLPGSKEHNDYIIKMNDEFQVYKDFQKNGHLQDAVFESRAARWAWHVSLIPLLGLPLFVLLAFIAMYNIGSKGRTGIWLLRKGVIAVLLLNAPYLGLYLAGYSGYYPDVYNKAYFYLPKHGIYQEFFENGKLRYQERYWFGKLDGKHMSWDSDGKVSHECEYKNDARNGKYRSLSENYREEGEYRNGLRNGTWTVRYGNGQKMSEGEYINDRREGKWSEWSENGRRMTEGTYKNDRKEGKWTEWWGEDNKEEGEYRNGRREGKWQNWYKSNLGAEEVYSDNILISRKNIPQPQNSPTPVSDPRTPK